MTGDAEYTEVHVRETVDLTGAHVRNALFRECVITGLRNSLLMECEFPECRVEIENPVDVLDATMTLNCWTFKDVQLSETVFDALVYLISLGRGNDEKRRVLREMVEPSRLRLFERVFPQMGTR